MSYDIIYNRLFVNLGNDRYILLFEAGSNNVWEANNKRRARDWSNYSHLTNGNLSTTREQLLARLEDIRQSRVESEKKYAEREGKESTYTDENFGSYEALSLQGRAKYKLSFQVFKNWCLNGMKKAMTIEELQKEGVSVRLYLSHYTEDNLKKAGVEPLSAVYFTSTEHALKTLEEWEAFTYANKVNAHLTLAGERNYEQMKDMKKIIRKKKEREKVEVNEYWVLKVIGRPEASFYFIKSTPSKMRITSYPSGARKFLTEKSVNQFYNRMSNKHRVKPEKITTAEKVTLYI